MEYMFHYGLLTIFGEDTFKYSRVKCKKSKPLKEANLYFKWIHLDKVNVPNTVMKVAYFSISVI